MDIMEDRVKTAANMGCDAVEPDNMSVSKPAMAGPIERPSILLC